MNIENIRKTRDLIASREPEAVNMQTWGFIGKTKDGLSPTLCGSVGCIGGWASLAKALEAGGGELKPLHPETWASDYNLLGIEIAGMGSVHAREWFGMDDEDGRYKSSNLFHAYDLPGGVDFFMLREATAEQQQAAVLKVLDILIETGEVDWPEAVRLTSPELLDA